MHTEAESSQQWPLERVAALYNQLSFDNLDLLAELYSEDVQFIDPVHEINGLAALEQYFAHAYENLQRCQFDIIASGTGRQWGFLSWQMTFSHLSINGGQPVVVDGCTELTYQTDGKICRHRDYYDLTQMMYRHLPVIGWLTAKVRQRMAGA